MIEILLVVVALLVFNHAHNAIIHLHDSATSSIAKEKSLLEKLLSKKLVLYFLLSTYALIISVLFNISILDTLKSNLWYMWLILIPLTVLLSVRFRRINFGKQQFNDKIHFFVNSAMISFLLALIFSFISSLISFYFIDTTEYNKTFVEYLNQNKPSYQVNNLSFLIEYIQIFKMGFIYFIGQYTKVEFVKYVFAFVTFFQSIFIFYYCSIITTTSFRILEEKSFLSPIHFLPALLTIVLILITPDIKIELNTATETITKEEQALKNILIENNSLKRDLEHIHNLHISIPMKCYLPFIKCTVEDVIDN